MRCAPIPVPRNDPRHAPLDPFLSLTSEDLMAAGALLAPAAAVYGAQATHLAVALAVAGLLACVPLILFPPKDGRRGYARVLAWATWLFEPRTCVPPTVARVRPARPAYILEVMPDGGRGRRHVLPDPAPGGGR